MALKRPHMLSNLQLCLVLACFNLLLQSYGSTEAGCTKSQVEEISDGVKLTAHAASNSSIEVEWISLHSTTILTPSIVYEEVYSHRGLLNVKKNSEDGLVSPVVIPNLQSNTLYEINFYGLFGSNLVAITVFVTTDECQDNAAILSRQRREVENATPMPEYSTDAPSTQEETTAVEGSTLGEFTTMDMMTTADTLATVYFTGAVFGDPHYQTFDGRRYDFHGSCEYKLSADCLSDVSVFEVKAQNGVVPGTNVAVTTGVTIVLGDTVIEMRNDGDVIVDGVTVTVPMFVPGVAFLTRSGSFVVVQTTSGVFVKYDQISYFSVHLDSSFSGRTCGLLGNFNMFALDDFTGASGTVQSIQNFGNSYITNPALCNDIAAPVPDPCLTATSLETGQADQLCSILQDTSGAFGDCVNSMSTIADTYYSNCRNDVCASSPDETNACSVILAFALFCQENGFSIQTWRSASVCPITCGADSTYNLNGDPCSESCTSLLDPTVLTGCNSTGSVEGCQCDEGFVVEGADCVSPNTCGCIKDGFYAPVGLVFQTQACTLECTCNGYDDLTCVNVSCDVNAVCEPTGCVCMEGYEGDGFTCQAVCLEQEFTCADGTCIGKSLICDLYPDCPDFSDEFEDLCCPTPSDDAHCPLPFHFRCPADGRYIPVSYLCDSYDYDCSDNYDESTALCSDLCYPPPNMAYGYHSPVLNFYMTNDTITFFCYSDYTLVGTNPRTCNGFDFGNEPFPMCYKNCDLPVAPQFGTLNNTDNTQGAVIGVVCDANYEAVTPGSFLICNNGTLEGTLSTCQLINLCLSDPCENDGTCSNNIGFFTCTCSAGWTGSTCSQDINECLGMNDCDQNATCINNLGSYTCECDDGFTGDGFYCREIRLFAFGDAQDDERLTLTSVDADGQTGDERELLSRTFVPPAGFPIGDNFYYSLYFMDNGIVVFINENAEKFGFPYPYSNGYDGTQKLVAVTPFWTDSDLGNDQGEVYYQVYEKSDTATTAVNDMLADANGRIRDFDADHPQFNATWMLVITWFEIPSFTTTTNTNTFQVGLVTDGTFGFAIFNYEEDQMLWNVAALASKNVIIGFNTGSGQYVNTHFQDPPFSTIADQFRPDQFVGNTGLGGRWIYRLEANNDTTINPKKFCLDWYDVQPAHQDWSRFLGTCPCTFSQAGNDRRLRSPGRRGGAVSPVGNSYRRLSQEVLAEIAERQAQGLSFCLQTAISPSGNGAGMTCCYRSDTSLIEGYGTTLESSFIERFQFRIGVDNNPLLLLSYILEDYLPRDSCCGLSRDPYFCDLYTEKRPAGSCTGYLPPRTAWIIGDPHFTSLDGYQYTFNGLGDYQVGLIYDGQTLVYEIQGRTQRVVNKETGELGQATFFDGFAIRKENATISFFLTSNNTDFSINIDDVEFNKTSLLEGDFQNDNFLLSAADGNLTTIYVIWRTLAVTIEVRSGLLDMLLQLPDQFKGDNTRGLIGVWNDDITDDFLLPNGTLLSPSGAAGNYTDEDFFLFGEAWRVDPADSFFDVGVSRDRRQISADAGFMPVFLSNLVSSFETSDPSFLNTARSGCSSNRQCLFDTLAAEDMALGMGTKNSQETNEASERVLENFPPNITADSTIIATVGELYYYQIMAKDPEGSMVTYSLESSNLTANISSDGLVIWNPVNVNQISLVVQASDGEALSAVQPTIIICDCQNNGTCQENVYTEASNIIANKFAVATCLCTAAYAGNFCEEDFDACLDDPCFPGITCFDNVAPLTGNRCGDGTCPEGLVGDGFKCFDLDECVAYANRSEAEGGPACSQICENTLNGFTCSCQNGYNLHPDMYQCIDINECELQTDECSENAVCDNSPGSYNCTCLDGYLDVNSDGRLCEDIDECLKIPPVCDDRATCMNINGSFTCLCNDGFEGNGRTCDDIDECSRNTDNCDTNADCNNIEGSFTCSCQPGWEGDGVNCTNVDECLDINLRECHPRALCMDTQGSYICFCPAGLFGNGIACDDLDECALGTSDCSNDVSKLCINTQGSYECRCNSGFTGNGTVCNDVNECTLTNGTQCSDQANCTNTYGSYDCTCQEGYAGDGITCSDVNECTTGNDCNPVSGACSNTIGSFSCICITGYQGDGRNCTDIDECATDQDDCDQICSNFIGGFTCSCRSGYEIDTSEPNLCNDVDECALNIDNCTQGCNNTAGGFFCYCFEGFLDDGNGDCTPQVNCTVDRCINGQCVYNGGNETCLCYEGYELSADNETLCIDINECQGSDLNMCEQVCMNTEGGYLCSCNAGYRLADNGRTCNDIDECAEDSDDCDEVSSTCINEVGGFRCMCNAGFERRGAVCSDVDECQGENDCSAQASCNNTLGSYVCTCNEGYDGNGQICVDINECAGVGMCDFFADCSNTAGSFVCTCNEGFLGNGLNCLDVDECTLSFLSNCSMNANCSNTAGSFMCTCNDGYEGNGQTCVNVNECSLPTSDPRAADCHPNAICTDSDGSYQCDCDTGYTGSGTSCIDVNECQTMNGCIGNSTCSNSVGSYLCTCNDGYRGDGFVLCEDIDECAENSDGCSSVATCDNYIGGFTCTCDTGYSGNGFTCTDVNECGGSDDCHPLADCSNTIGSYFCTCQPGFLSVSTITGRDCNDFNECILDPCGNNEVCLNNFGSYFCTCADGYELVNGTCADIDECLARPCQNVTNSRCENTMGGYNCICQTGFYSMDGACNSARTFSIAAVFSDIKGIVVLRNLYTDTFQSESKPMLQADLVALFNASSLTDFLGVTIRGCTLVDGGANVQFTVDLLKNTNTTEQEVSLVFFEGLVNDRIVAPDSILDFNTIVIGEPIMNPCEEQTDNCTTNAMCTFLGTSNNYTCDCNDGFMGDGFSSCSDINECDSDPCTEEGEVCMNTIGSFSCECRQEAGYFRDGVICVLYKGYQGQFTILEVNNVAEDAVFSDVYYDSTSLDFKILENRVCGSVRYSYILDPALQPYLVDCYVNSFSPGSIQAIWTVVFELDASTTATALESILLGSIVDEQNGDGVLISGTETLGNLTLLVAAIDVDYIVVECPDGYCFNGASCSVILGSYVCSCPEGFYGNQCELEATTVVTTEGTTVVTTEGTTQGTTEGTTEVSTVVTTESTTVMTTTTITPLTTDGEERTTDGNQTQDATTREDLEATVTERVYPTRPPVTPEPDDELSILELVLIIVGGASVLFLVLICCFCCCIFVSQRRPQGPPLAGYPPPPASNYYRPDPRVLYNMPIGQRTTRESAYGIRGPYYEDEYSDDDTFDTRSSDSFPRPDTRDSFRERENRLRHLAQVITQSPYLNEHMRDRTSRADARGPSTSRQFLRPYMASGHDGFEEQPHQNPYYTNASGMASAPPNPGQQHFNPHNQYY